MRSYKEGVPLKVLVRVIIVLAFIDIICIYLLNIHFGKKLSGEPLWSEVHKSLIQFLMASVIGTVVSFFIKGNEAHKAIEKGLDQFRKSLLAKLHKHYADTKRIRRILRATACTPAFNHKSSDMCKISAAKYDEQLLKLNDIQLDLEILKKELNDLPPKIFKSRGDVKEIKLSTNIMNRISTNNYTANKDIIVSSVRYMENYLTKIIEEWEEKGGHGGQRSEIDINELPVLKQFIKPAKEDFRINFMTYYGNCLEVIRESILFPFTL